MYQIECKRRADEAESYIHPELGKGHSNLPEAAHNVYIRFRSKSIQLERLHYNVSTNLAILQSAVSWAKTIHGSQYYWVKELYRLEIPVTDGMVKSMSSVLEDRGRQLEWKKSEMGKKYRVALKKARTEEAEERKRWAKSEAFSHDYGLGPDDEYSVDPDDPIEEEALEGNSPETHQEIFIQETK